MSDSQDIFQRTRLLLGENGVGRLQQAHVAVVGVGGVGSYAVEALCRAGIGELTLIDYDRIIPSNVNRQLHALMDTIGHVKVEEMAERCRRINPGVKVTIYAEKFDRHSADRLLSCDYDFVIDAIDTLSFKVRLLEMCVRKEQKVISSMGAASRILPDAISVGDLFSTRHCPLARMVRKRLRRRGIASGIPVVYSSELPILTDATSEYSEEELAGSSLPKGTISYMPALFGLHCAAYVIQQLLADVPLRRRGLTPRLRERGASQMPSV
jgi:tRNA A37 threonylcarbamoyladenosine dehydratase